MAGETVSDQLFSAIEAAIENNWSINAIAKEAGVSSPSLQNWYSGKRPSMSMEAIDKLCRHFEMRLTKPKVRKPPSNPRRKPKAKGSASKDS